MPRTRLVPGAEPEQRSQRATPVRVRPVAERGWASQPSGLEWRATPPGRRVDLGVTWGSWLVAETPFARYLVQERPHEVTAAVEPREPGRRTHHLGNFRKVAEAMAACERDYARRLASHAKDLPAELR